MRHTGWKLYYFSCLESQGTFHRRTRWLCYKISQGTLGQGTLGAPGTGADASVSPVLTVGTWGFQIFSQGGCQPVQEESQEIPPGMYKEFDAGHWTQDLRSGTSSWGKKRRNICGGCSVIPTDKNTSCLWSSAKTWGIILKLECKKPFQSRWTKRWHLQGTVHAERPTSPRTKMPIQTHQKPKFRDVRAKEKLQKADAERLQLGVEY